jgi:hypothetical protein
VTPAAWETCDHKFIPYFGPVLHCAKCGAETMATMDPCSSKAILPPTDHAALDALEAKRASKAKP